MPSGSVLVGDIGATNARFAVIEDGVCGPIAWIKGADYPVFLDAVRAFVEQQGNPPLAAVLLAVAGPVENNRCRLTNRSWLIDGAELRDTFGLGWARLVNDFEATAWSLPHLGEKDVHRIGGGRTIETAPHAALGPGTGFGMSCFVPGPSGGFVIASEGGHATLAAASRAEDRIIEVLRERFGHVSAERALSGSGLENLLWALARLEQVEVPQQTAADITKAALEGSCGISRAALDLFCAFLGSVAGDAALTFGARGGVFLAGGIAPRILPVLEQSEFRARFEAKGPMRPYAERIPTSVILSEDATFVGLQVLVQHVLAQSDHA
jgi:glucokinase